MQDSNVSENNFEQCLKCSICTTVCPMMAATPHYPGPKQAGPDGERYRLKDPAFYDLTLKYCLNCKRCEVSCPSGVKIGDIIQSARLKYGRSSNVVRDYMLAETDLAGNVASAVAPIANRMLGLKPVKAVMDGVLGIDAHRTFPTYSHGKFENRFRSEVSFRQLGFRRFISYFHGCYVNYNYPQLGMDLVKLVNACGYGVHLLDREKCCGVALISNGFGKQARKQARINLKSFRTAVSNGETVLTTSSTCTFTMRDEYRNVLGLDNSDVRDSLLLATKWLYDHIEDGSIRIAFRKDYHKRIVYHTACHMNKLGWAIYSTSLLKMIPGVELLVPEQQCCGIAGTFGFKKENYPYSQAIGSALFETLKSFNPDVVATDCETCKWQIEMSAGLPVMNPVSILAEAMDEEETIKMNIR